MPWRKGTDDLHDYRMNYPRRVFRATEEDRNRYRYSLISRGKRSITVESLTHARGGCVDELYRQYV